MSSNFERVFSFGVNSFKIVVSNDNKSLSFQVLSMDERFRCKQAFDIKYHYESKNGIVIRGGYFPEIVGHDSCVECIYLQGERNHLDDNICNFKCYDAMMEYQRIYHTLLDWFENWFPKDEIVMEIPRWKRFVILPKERRMK